MGKNSRSRRKPRRSVSEDSCIYIPSQILPQCSHAQPLPTSTRGIGFAVSYTYTFLNRLRHFQININQLYRASLIQFQVQLFEASEKMFYHQIIPKDYKNMHMHQIDRRYVIREPKNFKMITMVINTFGPFHYNGIYYQPYLPESSIPNAYTVTINNLRETVVALSSSDANTKEARWKFYDRNSIPGAQWDVQTDTQNAVLINADEIIPAEYDLSADYTSFVDQMRDINHEYVEHIENLTYSGKGHQSQLVSIKVSNDRIPNCSIMTTKGENYIRYFSPPQTELVAYAYGHLDKQEMFRGIICLFGEIDSDNFDHDTWSYRSDLTGSTSVSYPWENCAFHMLNNIATYLNTPLNFSMGNFALPLPVSNRGIGFAVSYIYTLLSEHRNLEITIHELFRASLLQFRFRVYKSAEYRFKNLVIPKDFFNLYSIVDPRCIRPHPNNFRLIAAIINNFGSFEENGIEYYPVLPDCAIPNPFNVTIENLRGTVIALSSPTANNKSIRWKFYQRNSIPGAIWNVNETNEDAVLTNPDEIMPRDYEMFGDLEALAKCMSVLQIQDSEYVGKIRYSGQGKSCQLVSIPASDDRIPSSMKLDENNYQHYPPISKGIVAHAKLSLNTKEMLYGILGLYGEYCDDFMDYDIWECRLLSTGSCSSPNTLWKTLARYSAKLNV